MARWTLCTSSPLTLIVSILIGLVSVTISLRQVRYDGYKVFRLKTETQEHIDALRMVYQHGGLFWSVPDLTLGGSTNVMFPPHLHGSFLEGLEDKGMKVEQVHGNVQSLIDENTARHSDDSEMSWTRYHRLRDIHAFLRKQVADHKNVAKLYSLGRSSQGREILGIKISKSERSLHRREKPRPAIWIDSNIHAREWITSSVSTYLINQLLNSNTTEMQRWTDVFDWYIIPVLNPDGFEYSHAYVNDSKDRMWRRSRSHSPSSALGCRGVDLNRNFGFHWMEVGASNDSCSDRYAGPFAFSEPETLALAKAINDLVMRPGTKLQIYLSLHAFSQLILFPFAYTTERFPQYDAYEKITNKAITAHAQRYGTEYRAGPVVKLLYPASGCSADWVKGVHNVSLVLTYELRDTGHYAMLLPQNQILPTAEEFMEGLRVYVKEIQSWN